MTCCVKFLALRCSMNLLAAVFPIVAFSSFANAAASLEVQTAELSACLRGTQIAETVLFPLAPNALLVPKFAPQLELKPSLESVREEGFFLIAQNEPVVYLPTKLSHYFNFIWAGEDWVLEVGINALNLGNALPLVLVHTVKSATLADYDRVLNPARWTIRPKTAIGDKPGAIQAMRKLAEHLLPGSMRRAVEAKRRELKGESDEDLAFRMKLFRTTWMDGLADCDRALPDMREVIAKERAQLDQSFTF